MYTVPSLLWFIRSLYIHSGYGALSPLHSVVIGCTQDQYSSHLTYQDILWHYPLYYLLFMQHPYPMGSEETLCVITTAIPWEDSYGALNH
jgi:hypothetical protein